MLTIDNCDRFCFDICMYVTRCFRNSARDIEDSSWVRVRDKDIFSRRVTERPSDEGARSARNVPGKDTLFRTRRLEEFYIFQLEVDCDTLSS